MRYYMGALILLAGLAVTPLALTALIIGLMKVADTVPFFLAFVAFPPPAMWQGYALNLTVAALLIWVVVELALGKMRWRWRLASPLLLTSMTWLNDDYRCRMGEGRCIGGPSSCDPTSGAAVCAGEGGICVACGGTLSSAGANPAYDASDELLLTDPVNGNATGLPVGYTTHGAPALDLVNSGGVTGNARLGGVNGIANTVRVPLIALLTTGNAATEFRDEPGGTFDLALLGQWFNLG